MKLLYVADIRLPTEKAHGGTIMRMCEAFGTTAAVELLVPTRRNSIDADPFTYYRLQPNFRITRIAIPDFTRFGKLGYRIQGVLFALRAASYVRRRQPDAVYGRDAAALLAASYTGIPVFWEAHQALDNVLVRRLLRRVRGIVCISKGLVEFLCRRGADASKMLIAPSGVDVRVFDASVSKEEARAKLKLPTSRFIALYTGNFTTMGEDKGIADIIKALPRAPQTLFIAIGGNGPDRAHYEAEAERMGVKERAQFFGHAPQATFALYQKAADVLLMPFPDTPHYRNMMSPVKMFEYMASGRPIIASDLPTIREILNERNAFIIPPDSPESIARTMREILDAPEAAEKRALVAHTEVKRYAWSERANRILSFVTSAP